MNETTIPTDEAFRFVDLFAGLGGFHVALRDLGGLGVFAAEWDQTLNHLYRKNFGTSEVWGDVELLNSEDVIQQTVPEHDLLAAGFPCQPFSKAGEQLGFEDTLQGQLFFRVLDILKAKKPRTFILENVPNILRHQNGNTAEIIVEQLRQLGYEVQVHRLSPHHFGVPQVRERAYFVGSLVGLPEFKWPGVGSNKTSVTSVISRKSVGGRAIPSQTLQAIDMWSDFLRRSPLEVKLPSFPIWSMEFGADYPFEVATPPALWDEKGSKGLNRFRGSFGFELAGLSLERQQELVPSHARRSGDYSFPRWKRLFITQNREFYKSNEGWINPWLDQWKPWLLPSSLQKFEWNAQGGRRDIDHYVIQVRASGIRVKRPITAPSLIAMTHTQVPILGSRIAGTRRYMTPRECAALQSLGEIDLPENDLQAYKALGNAVNARVVREIAEQLVLHAGLATPAVQAA